MNSENSPTVTLQRVFWRHVYRLKSATALSLGAPLRIARFHTRLAEHAGVPSASSSHSQPSSLYGRTPLTSTDT